MRRIGGVVVALVLVGVAPLAAQYFGQNKVQYESFDFRIIQTEHFEVYYYPAERAGALDAARMAERWYARLSRILHHQFQGRKPIILYASQSDFQQTNIIDATGEGLGGVTEFFKHRMVLPFTGSYAELEHVIGHEMVHQFQYDVFSRGRIGAGVQTLINVNPPLWFMEGMAEYLSVGPIDPHTAMWLRDAALEGHLPTTRQLNYDEVFPYYFGHAIWAYIGEKWGDEAIGEILQASISSGIEGAVKRALGISLDDLFNEWRDAVQTTYLPQLAEHYKARRIAQPVLTKKRSDGTLHLAPALTPDGRDIAYFSERNSFFVDLYLADAETGRVKRRLVKSTLNSNFESLRFINSAGSFSPDGRYFAIAAKHKDRDDLVILDIKRDREVRRIPIPLSGLTTPAWSPDGKQLVFTGYDGGLSDLFIVNADGSDLRRLTNDKYADLQPAWSPDGKTIAFTTDRDGETDFNTLKFGNMRIGLYHLDDGRIELLKHMDQGKNINPAWAPDGRSLAFVSDRGDGISNIFLYDFADGNVYQLTDVYTGVTGITPLSPCLSWAHEADRLAFAYYEDGEYNVYGLDNPRSLKRQPYQPPATPPVASLLAAQRRPVTPATIAPGAPSGTAKVPEPRAGESVYRTPTGFRASAAPATPGTPDSTSPPGPVSVKALIDSSPALPDTNEFTMKPYHTRFSPDYVARPTIGYERDNFGRGFFGGTAISLSDMLGNHTLAFAGSVNGRLSEAQVLAAYLNQAHRLNWLAGASQTPYYFYLPTPVQSGAGTPYDYIQTLKIERFVVRDVFTEGYYPFSRFTRVELGGHFANIDQSILSQDYGCVNNVGCGAIADAQTQGIGSVSYYGPQVALVHDNTLFGWVGPFAGARSRLQISPSFGSWRFTEGLADVRRYFFARPFTFAFRGLVYGRRGRDADLFPQFLGSTELIRGYTAGSLFNNECLTSTSTSTGPTGCPALDQLIGSSIGVFNAELRFPLTRSVVLGFLPVGLPPIEGALFYDAGLAWNNGSQVRLRQSACSNPDPEVCRVPVKSWGGSIRMNFLGFVVLRFDYTKPLDRPLHNSAYWTVSLGPTF